MSRKILQIRGRETKYSYYRDIQITHKNQPGENFLPKWLKCPLEIYILPFPLLIGRFWKKKTSTVGSKEFREIGHLSLAKFRQCPTERAAHSSSQRRKLLWEPEERGASVWAMCQLQGHSCFRQKPGLNYLLLPPG
jgi:hypothetical protein